MSPEIRPKSFGTFEKQAPDPDICSAGAVLHLLSYDANYELVIIWFYGKPVDCGYTYLRRSSALKNSFHPHFTNMKFHALILQDI